MGAASARMPVTIAKRFIVEIPFSAGPLGRFGVGEERSALTGCARGRESQVRSALNLLLHIRCRWESIRCNKYSLIFSFFPPKRAKNGLPHALSALARLKTTRPAAEAG
jgi:hypothetical protein